MPLTICCLTTISIASILASYLWIGPADPQMSSWCPAGGSPGWGSAWHHSQYWDDPATQRKTVHYSDVIMGTMASQITSLLIVYSTVYSSADQRKHQSSTSLAFVRGIHRWPVNSPDKRPVTRKMFPFDDIIMWLLDRQYQNGTLQWCRISIMASLITGNYAVCSTGRFSQVCNKESIKATDYWPFVRRIHCLLVDSPHKEPVIQEVSPFHEANNWIQGQGHSQSHRQYQMSRSYIKHFIETIHFTFILQNITP